MIGFHLGGITRRGRVFLVFLVGITVSACGHVPLTSIAKLSSFDIETTDPRALRVAAVLPDTIRVAEGDARLDLEIVNTVSGETLLSESLELDEKGTTAEKAELSSELTDGKHLLIFALSEEDLAYFRSFQELIRTRSAAEKKAHEGTLALHVTGCAIKEPGPAPLRITTFLKASELGGFVTLTRNADLSKTLKEAGVSTSGGVKLCPIAVFNPA